MSFFEAFTEYRPTGASREIIEKANAILAEYQADDYTLTLRQLYYQFVARGLLENTERSYKNLGKVVTRGRMGGLISWTAIEDRGRSSFRVQGEDSAEAVLQGIEDAIVLDPWEDQDNYVEVWIEKEALHNVIERPCDAYRVTHMACKGYLSASEAWRSGMRFLGRHRQGKNLHVIHLGDHDPSGIDMTRDNQDRLELFSGCRVTMHRIALNYDQVQQYSPPPNPTKMSDSRANDYFDRHGGESWELDALDPKVLDRLVRDHLQPLITDGVAWDETFDREKELQTSLSQLHDNWGAIEHFLKTSI